MPLDLIIKHKDQILKQMIGFLLVLCQNLNAQDLSLADTREEVSWNHALWPVFLLVAFFLIKLFFHLKNKNIRSGFLADFFIVAGKNNIDFKIMGKIHLEEVEKLLPIKEALLNTIHLSRGISNLVELKFNRANHKFNVEIDYLTNRPLQYLCDVQKEIFLKNHLISLQQEVEKIGGELLYKSKYNSSGVIYQSSVVIRFDS